MFNIAQAVLTVVMVQLLVLLFLTDTKPQFHHRLLQPVTVAFMLKQLQVINVQFALLAIIAKTAKVHRLLFLEITMQHLDSSIEVRPHQDLL